VSRRGAAPFGFKGAGSSRFQTVNRGSSVGAAPFGFKGAGFDSPPRGFRASIGDQAWVPHPSVLRVRSLTFSAPRFQNVNRGASLSAAPFGFKGGRWPGRLSRPFLFGPSIHKRKLFRQNNLQPTRTVPRPRFVPAAAGGRAGLGVSALFRRLVHRPSAAMRTASADLAHTVRRHPRVGRL
jgi:hypothetical protein